VVELFNPSNVSIGSYTAVALAGGGFTTLGSVPPTFSVDGTWTAVATVTDLAGNTATDTFAFEVDETGPSSSVSSVLYDDNGGIITISGTFDASDIAQVGSAVGSWVDGAGFGPTTPTGTQTVNGGGAVGDFDNISWTDTEIVLDLNAGAQAFLEGNATVGGVLEDTLDILAGGLTDANGNPSAGAFPGETITLHISTSNQGVAALTGFGGDDELEADSAPGDTLTGGAGADKFIIDNIYVGGPATGTTIATITDFDSTESDLIQLDASDISGLITGPGGFTYTPGDDGSAIAFSNFDTGVVTAATNIGGTLIYDSVNQTLRIDYQGDTSWDGATITDTSLDDDIIDLTGINGVLTASDIDFLS